MNPQERQLAIANEFGESFESIIIGFRQQGCSWATIAGALNVPCGSLKGWISELGLYDGNYQRELPHAPLEIKARKLGYRNVERMLWEYRGSGKMLGELASDLGCHISSLYRYMPEDLRGEWVLDPSQKKNNPAGGWKNPNGRKPKWR